MRLLLGLIFGVSLWGQSVSQMVYTAVLVGTPAPVVVRNNGQTSHMIILSTTGCTTATGAYAVIQISIDNTNWLTVARADSVNTIVQATVSGGYPFTRVALSVVGANCLGSVAYLGANYISNPILMGTENYSKIILPMTVDSLGNIISNPAGSREFVHITTDVADTKVCDGLLPQDTLIAGILIGKGGTTSTATLKRGTGVGAVTLSIMSTTSPAFYPINFTCGATYTYYIDTASSGTAADITVFTSAR
jgi:hypothetical protein